MPDTETYFNPNTKRYEARRTSTGADVASAVEKSKLQDTTGIGASAKHDTGDMPKQSDYPDSSSWASAVREWRSKKDQTAGLGENTQQRALSSLPDSPPR